VAIASHVFWGYCNSSLRCTMSPVITASFDTMAIAVVMIFTGVLMLAYVVRGLPQSPAVGTVQSGVVLVATKPKKKSKGNA
jgi:hypothetical protein